VQRLLGGIFLLATGKMHAAET
jgi:hypothetical protein